MCTWTLRTLWWVDTRDMIADGLKKGIIARSALISAASEGYWKLNYECRRHQELLRTPVLDPLRDEPALQAQPTNARLREGKQIRVVVGVDVVLTSMSLL